MNTKKGIYFLVLLIFLSVSFVYSSSLNLVWWADYHGVGDDWAYSVATDSLNNVIVTGVSYDLSYRGNYHTIKYDPNGTLIWEKSYNSGGNDTAWAVAADSQNNVIVTGQSSSRYYTIKYDPNGNELWTTGTSGPFGTAFGVATDFQDNIIVAGTSGANYYMIKYTPNGDVIWTKSHNAGGTDYAYDVTVDNQNNIIATGTSSKGGFTRNYHTAKFDLNGNLIWSKEYGGAGWDEAWGVVTDSHNNVIVTGRAQSNHPNDYLNRFHTIKYDSNGNEIWAAGGIDGIIGTAWDIDSDSQNNIIVTGGYVVSGKRNYYTIMYSSGGKILWNDIHPVGGLGEPWGVVADSQNNIIVTGVSRISGTDNYYTIKYQPEVPPTPPVTPEIVIFNPKELPMNHISRILGIGDKRTIGGFLDEGNTSQIS
ncbi:MAG: hypothetical protein KO464_11270 [Candidatus Methanofastidiosum sp.]|nr:hypothetical protein [Methanofastidiosum sp.]